MIGNYWGKTILVDENTTSKAYLEFGRVLIATEESAVIKGKMKLIVEGEAVMVTIIEEHEVVGSTPRENEEKVKAGRVNIMAERVGRGIVEEESGKAKWSPGIEGVALAETMLSKGKEIQRDVLETGEQFRDSPNPSANFIVERERGGESAGDLSRSGPGKRHGQSMEEEEESPDELRSIFENQAQNHEDSISRVGDSISKVVSDREEEKWSSGEKGGVGTYEVLEDGGWTRNSRGEKREKRRKRVPVGHLLGNHVLQIQRSRSRKGRRRNKNHRKSLSGGAAEPELGVGIEVRASSGSEVEGVDKSVSEDTIKKLNVREKPPKDRAWEVGKRLGLNILGSEEALVERMAKEREKSAMEYMRSKK